MNILNPFAKKPALTPADRPAGTGFLRESAAEYERLAPWRARLDHLDEMASAASAEYRAHRERISDLYPALQRQREIVEQLRAEADRSAAIVKRWSARDHVTAATQREIDAAERGKQELAIAEEKLARREGQMDRINAQQSAASDRHQLMGHLALTCKQWLEDNKAAILKGYAPPQVKPHKGPASAELVEQLSGEIEACKVKLAGLRDVLPLQAEREEVIDAAIASMAAEFETGIHDAPASPWTMARARNGTRIFKGQENLPTGSMMAMLCWFSPNLMRDRLLELADEGTDPHAERLSASDLAARRASIESKLYEFERQQEFAIRELEAAGEVVLRRKEADPCSVLCP